VSDVSAIEWTDATWNPVTGCTRVSPGCANCYIERTPPFRMASRRFEIVGQESTTGVTLHPDRLEQPLRWWKPRRVFVCSLADLFHDDVDKRFIAEVFARMALAHKHTFQVLTKRPERMRDVLRDPFWWACVEGAAQRVIYETTGEDTSYTLAIHGPLPNVWLGVSIENARYTWRADVLREITAAVRFISAEPLLGSLFDVRARDVERSESPALGPPVIHHTKPLDLAGIEWVIIGGESGPGARPFQLEHARAIIRACRAHDVAPFVKQLGSRPVDGANHGGAGPLAGSWSYTVPLQLRDRKGGCIDEWPADLRIREFPETAVAA
jgi:protein gp37